MHASLPFESHAQKHALGLRPHLEIFTTIDFYCVDEDSILVCYKNFNPQNLVKLISLLWLDLNPNKDQVYCGVMLDNSDVMESKWLVFVGSILFTQV